MRNKGYNEKFHFFSRGVVRCGFRVFLVPVLVFVGGWLFRLVLCVCGLCVLLVLRHSFFCSPAEVFGFASAAYESYAACVVVFYAVNAFFQPIFGFCFHSLHLFQLISIYWPSPGLGLDRLIWPL